MLHTIDLLEQAISVAEQLGYGVRREWLGGSTGGGCEIAGKKWVFIDLALNVVEQLDQISEVLMADPGIYSLRLDSELRQFLGIRSVA